MSLLEFFLPSKKNSANLAKERLQIIVTESRRGARQPHYLPQLKRDILHVICRYVQIDPDQLTLQLEQKGNDVSVLELNVTLPEEKTKAPKR